MTESLLYRCADCHDEFLSDWSDEEAAAEYETLFGRPFDPDHVEALCDDCYEIAWARLKNRRRDN